MDTNLFAAALRTFAPNLDVVVFTISYPPDLELMRESMEGIGFFSNSGEVYRRRRAGVLFEEASSEQKKQMFERWRGATNEFGL
jgi:hypothetical protein